ncbi:hypothetical protein LTR94_025399, partial [Friedmanniomyces endolithicus]
PARGHHQSRPVDDPVHRGLGGVSPHPRLCDLHLLSDRDHDPARRAGRLHRHHHIVEKRLRLRRL